MESSANIIAFPINPRFNLLSHEYVFGLIKKFEPNLGSRALFNIDYDFQKQMSNIFHHPYVEKGGGRSLLL